MDDGHNLKYFLFIVHAQKKRKIGLLERRHCGVGARGSGYWKSEESQIYVVSGVQRLYVRGRQNADDKVQIPLPLSC